MNEDSLWSHPLVRVFRNLALAGHFLLTPLALLGSGLFLLVAESAPGRLVGAGVIAGWLASVLVWLLLSERFRRLAWAGIVILLGLVLILGGSAYQMRRTGPPADNNFTQHYIGDARLNRTSLSHLVPELDQLKFGTFVMGSADSHLAKSGTGRLRELVLNIYHEADQDPAFRESSSALGFCYEDMLLGERDLLHFYQYVPRQLGREHYPVLIFLHGSLGNFKGYTWVLRRFADQTGIAIIAPTFGAGDWRKDRHGAVLRQVLEYAATQPELDARRPYLGGISNGGMGVTRALVRGGAPWAGVVLISPVIEQKIIQKAEFIQHARGLPILIIHGEVDDRIPAPIIRQLAQEMRGNGAAVTESYYPGEDHFLLFSQPEAVVADMVDWREPPSPL